MIFPIILVIADTIAMFWWNHVNFITWVGLCFNITFILRPIGVKRVKVEKIIPAEFLFAFLSFNGSLLLKTFSIKNYLVLILLRCIFYIIVYYEDKEWVLFQEEEIKEI